MRRDRALVFDLDDTLYRERRSALSSYAALARHLEVTAGLDPSNVFRLMRTCLQNGARAQALQRLCDRFDLHPAGIPELVGVMRTHRQRLRLPIAARNLLRDVRSTWRTAILTNGMPHVQRRKVEALGVEREVDRVFYAVEHGGIGKPDAVPFLAVSGALGVSPDRMVMVGNDPVCDVQGALNAGLHAILVEASRGAEPRDLPAGVAVVTRLTDVQAIAERLVTREREHVA